MSCFAELTANSFCQLGFWLTLKLATMPVPRRTIESKHILSRTLVRLVMQAGAQGYVLKSDLGECLVKALKRVPAGQRFLTTRVSDILLENSLKVEQRTERIRAS
jgi:hypothetical protein